MATDFSRGIQSVLSELQLLGLHYNSAKEIQFSEIGLGGATTVNGQNQPAGTPALAAASPWAGSGGGIYDINLDPWATVAMRQFRYDFHSALIDFLRDQPDSHPVTAAYLWSMASWDPQGIYFDGPEFRDPRIVQLIRDYNACSANVDCNVGYKP